MASGVTVVDFRPGDYRTAVQLNRCIRLRPQSLPTPILRIGRAWKKLESNLGEVTLIRPKRRADLLSALRRGESGTVYSGSFFQTQLAPLFSRFAPSRLRRAITARYFGAV